MNRSDLDFQVRGFVDRIQKAALPALSTQSVAILPFTDSIVHTKTDPSVIEWWKDPYLLGAGLPIPSQWLHLVKPSNYMADPLRAEQYSHAMQLSPDVFYNRRLFFGRINFYSSGGTLYFQRRCPNLQAELNGPYIDGRLWNMSCPSTETNSLFNTNLVWSGISSINIVGANDWLGLQFDGYWILWKE